MSKQKSGKPLLNKHDHEWLRIVALPFMGMEWVEIEEDVLYKGAYPDIWSYPARGRIVITEEWSKADTDSRRTRLLHELIHIAWGWDHDSKMGYYSRPERDTYSRKIYRRIQKGGRP